MNKYWIGLAIVVVTTLAFLPKIASTPIGKPLFIKVLETKLEGKVEVDSLSFSWLGPQKFKGLKWSRGELNGTVEELQITAPFWSFSGPYDLKNGSLYYNKESIDLTGFIKDGQIHLDANSPSLQMSVRGYFTKDAIALTKPLIAHFRLTSELSVFLLKNINPLFVTAIDSQNPVALQIEPQDFFFPLPYSLKKLHIAKGTLDLGKIRMLAGRSTIEWLNFLKGSSPTPWIDSWFTPILFTVRNGTLELGRFDFLVDSIHIAAWGNINLMNEQLDMTLGLPADTLQHAFGIQTLSENYVLTVPLRGTIKEPEIVKGAAAAKIAALLTAKQVPKKGLFGKLAEMFSNPPVDKDVPPAKKPFPWDK